MKYFKSDIFQKKIHIPFHHPAIKEVVDIHIHSEANQYSLIQTEKGYSFEGQYLSGYLLDILLKINILVTYTTYDQNNSIYSFTTFFYKNTNIVIPDHRDILFKSETKSLVLYSIIEAVEIINIKKANFDVTGIFLVYL